MPGGIQYTGMQPRRVQECARRGGLTLCILIFWGALKTTSGHEANTNFVVNGTRGCHYDNPRCHQWWQRWHCGNVPFSIKYNIYIYLFIIFQHRDGRMIKSLHKESLSVTHGQYNCCWCPGNARSRGISIHGVDLVLLKYSGFSTRAPFTNTVSL